MILGTTQQFLSADSADKAEVNELNYPVKLLKSIAGSASFLDFMLTLRKGCVVMLLRNLQFKNGTVIGSQYIVESMTNRDLCLQIATDSNKKKVSNFPHILCELGKDDFPIPGFR